MERRDIIEKRPEHIEDNTRSDNIPFLGGRPLRDTVIGKDEILNLTIQLNTTHSIDDFLLATN